MFQVKSALAEIARGNKDAEAFLFAFYAWAHSLDDLIDRDKPAQADGAVWAHTHLFFTLAGNAFFQEHQRSILPVVLVNALAYVSSEELKGRANVLDRITAQDLKSQYLDVFFIVAFVVGGYDHAMAMNRKYREYSFDAEPVTGGGRT